MAADILKAAQQPMVFQTPDLRRAVQNLPFDMYHFRLYSQTHEQLLGGFRSTPCYQATIYSMLLHFRVLMHFFYGTPTKDDCCVGHFRILPGFEAAFPPSIHATPLWEEEVRNHLNKRLAHFTATRWTENQPPLDYYRVHFPEVLELVRLFEAALPGEIGYHFAEKMKFWESQYRPL